MAELDAREEASPEYVALELPVMTWWGALVVGLILVGIASDHVVRNSLLLHEAKTYGPGFVLFHVAGSFFAVHGFLLLAKTCLERRPWAWIGLFLWIAAAWVGLGLPVAKGGPAAFAAIGIFVLLNIGLRCHSWWTGPAAHDKPLHWLWIAGGCLALGVVWASPALASWTWVLAAYLCLGLGLLFGFVYRQKLRHPLAIAGLAVVALGPLLPSSHSVVNADALLMKKTCDSLLLKRLPQDHRLSTSQAFELADPVHFSSSACQQKAARVALGLWAKRPKKLAFSNFTLFFLGHSKPVSRDLEAFLRSRPKLQQAFAEMLFRSSYKKGEFRTGSTALRPLCKSSPVEKKRLEKRLLQLALQAYLHSWKKEPTSRRGALLRHLSDFLSKDPPPVGMKYHTHAKALEYCTGVGSMGIFAHYFKPPRSQKDMAWLLMLHGLHYQSGTFLTRFAAPLRSFIQGSLASSDAMERAGGVLLVLKLRGSPFSNQKAAGKALVKQAKPLSLGQLEQRPRAMQLLELQLAFLKAPAQRPALLSKMLKIARRPWMASVLDLLSKQAPKLHDALPEALLQQLNARLQGLAASKAEMPPEVFTFLPGYIKHYKAQHPSFTALKQSLQERAARSKKAHAQRAKRLLKLFP